jgi:hypothetical protein
MTKHFTDVKVWERNLCLIGHFQDDVFAKAFAKPSGASPECDLTSTTDNGLVGDGAHSDSTDTAAASAVHIPNRFSRYVYESLSRRYTLIEFCCFEDSILGSLRAHKGICRIVKITEELDGRSHKANDLIHLVCNQSKGRVVIWGSLPCTGGCTWNYINGKTPEGKAKIEAHISLMTSLLKGFIKAAKLVLNQGGIVCFEWPRTCMYWKRKDVISMINSLGLNKTTFCGCAVGLRSFIPGNEHMFLKKPWTIYSNSNHIDSIFSKFVCPGVSDVHIHDQCRGKNAKGSERYTDMFASSAHRAFRAEFGC